MSLYQMYAAKLLACVLVKLNVGISVPGCTRSGFMSHETKRPD
jgi:hypothetical protein